MCSPILVSTTVYKLHLSVLLSEQFYFLEEEGETTYVLRRLEHCKHFDNLTPVSVVNASIGQLTSIRHDKPASLLDCFLSISTPEDNSPRRQDHLTLFVSVHNSQPARQ
jgi:hypothetical protein